MAHSSMGNLLHMVPLDLSELPSHPCTPPSDSPQPHLLTFLVTILDEAYNFLSPSTIPTSFTSIRTASSPPSAAPVELLKRQIRASDLSSTDWTDKKKHRVTRKRQPAQLADENWFARRSVHQNVSSKAEDSGSASWDEFVFAFKENHSRHEQEFTPTLYDAHHVLDWNEQIGKLRTDDEADRVELRGEIPGIQYSDITMEIFENCHSLPGPLSPRCFPVLVITAYTSAASFIMVTVPVNLTSPTPLRASYYSIGRNKTDPDATQQQRKPPVLGVYAAVVTVALRKPGEDQRKRDGSTEAKEHEEIEMIMATASDAEGNLPMFVQKPNMPAAVAKDVGLFMRWIRTVDVDEQRQNERNSM